MFDMFGIPGREFIASSASSINSSGLSGRQFGEPKRISTYVELTVTVRPDDLTAFQMVANKSLSSRRRLVFAALVDINPSIFTHQVSRSLFNIHASFGILVARCFGVPGAMAGWVLLVPFPLHCGVDILNIVSNYSN